MKIRHFKGIDSNETFKSDPLGFSIFIIFQYGLAKYIATHEEKDDAEILRILGYLPNTGIDAKKMEDFRNIQRSK